MKRLLKIDKLSRRPWARILRIHDGVKAGAYPNCVALARAMEISAKTLKRDVEFMRESLRLPIEYDSKRHGYFYSKPVDKFPGVSVTEQEMFALLVAHKAIAQYHGTPFQKPLRMAFEKLTEQLDGGARYSLDNLEEALSFRPFAPEDTDLQAFQLITRALQERRTVQFHYRKPGEKESQSRRVRPYHMTCSDNRWYILGHDTARDDIRTFALGRIAAPVLTDHHFEKPADFDPQKYLKGSFTVMKGEGDYEVVIEFDAWATDQIRGRQWHPTQEVTELPSGGGSHLRLRLSGLEEIERWILSWGTHATVVKPETLAKRVATTAMDLVGRYPRLAP